jgi:hypothetical protein
MVFAEISEKKKFLAIEDVFLPGIFPFPGAPNCSRVQFRPGINSSGYKRQGFEIQG